MSHLLGHRYSHTTVSRITRACAGAGEGVSHVPLAEALHRGYLDVLFVKVLHQEAWVQKEAVYVVLGTIPEGQREVLGFLPGSPRSRPRCGRKRCSKTSRNEGYGECWCLSPTTFLGSRRSFPGCTRRRVSQCVVHKVCSTLSKEEDQEAVAWNLKGVTGQNSPRRRGEPGRAFMRRWGGRLFSGGASEGGGSGVVALFLWGIPRHWLGLLEEHKPSGAVHAGAEARD